MKFFNFFNKKPQLPNEYKFYSTPNGATNVLQKDQDFAKPEINVYAGREYVPFGTDNRYPYILLELYHGSPFHSAILKFKTKAMMADGLEVTIPDTGLTSRINQEKLQKILSKSFFKRFIQEYLIHERIYIKVNRKGQEISNNILIVPAEEIRVANEARDFDKGYYQNDWIRGWVDMRFYKPFDKYNTIDKTQIIEYQELTPGFKVYAVPEYASSGDWIWLDSQIAYFQKQNMQNSINPSVIIRIYEKFANKTEEEEYVADMSRSFASARNAGKVMTLVSNGKELSPDVQITEPNKLDKSFAAVQENIVKNVSRSHLVNPAIMGIETAGKLGNSNEINEAYTLFNELWLSSNQDLVESYLQDLVIKIGYPDAQVTIKRKDKFLPVEEETNII